ncbi:hypothetical protein ScPMuIL_006837 [Solemya velum]
MSSVTVQYEDGFRTPPNRPKQLHARLHALQVDPGTYCNGPSGSLDNYQKWIETFNLENMKGNISELLVSKVEVRSLYTRLVPCEISHAEFWKHYFYKLHQLQIDEARKLAMMKRAENADTKEDSISWDDDWSGEDDRGGQEENRTVEERLHSTEDDVKDILVISHRAESEDKINGGSSEDVETSNSSGRDNDDRTSPGLTTVIDKNIMQVVKSDSSLNARDDIISGTVTDNESDVAEQAVTDGPISCLHSEPCKDSTDMKVDVEELNTKVKGDMVVVVSNRDSPSSESSGAKEVGSVSEDWEQDFDIELTEEDLKAAEEIAQKMKITDKDYNTITGVEDWENWE